jgi:hypothetical protein
MVDAQGGSGATASEDPRVEAGDVVADLKAGFQHLQNDPQRIFADPAAKARQRLDQLRAQEQAALREAEAAEEQRKRQREEQHQQRMEHFAAKQKRTLLQQQKRQAEDRRREEELARVRREESAERALRAAASRQQAQERTHARRQEQMYEKREQDEQEMVEQLRLKEKLDRLSEDAHARVEREQLRRAQQQPPPESTDADFITAVPDESPRHESVDDHSEAAAASADLLLERSRERVRERRRAERRAQSEENARLRRELEAASVEAAAAEVEVAHNRAVAAERASEHANAERVAEETLRLEKEEAARQIKARCSPYRSPRTIQEHKMQVEGSVPRSQRPRRSPRPKSLEQVSAPSNQKHMSEEEIRNAQHAAAKRASRALSNERSPAPTKEKAHFSKEDMKQARHAAAERSARAFATLAEERAEEQRMQAEEEALRSLTREQTAVYRNPLKVAALVQNAPTKPLTKQHRRLRQIMNREKSNDDTALAIVRSCVGDAVEYFLRTDSETTILARSVEDGFNGLGRKPSPASSPRPPPPASGRRPAGASAPSSARVRSVSQETPRRPRGTLPPLSARSAQV